MPTNRRYADEDLIDQLPSSDEAGAPLNPAVSKIATDVRVLLSLPLLGQMMIMGIQMTAYERANLAWDQVDALLAVRRERRARHIEGLKERGEFHPRQGDY
jgi:hypothetical protein